MATPGPTPHHTLELHRQLLDVAARLFAERDIHRLCDAIVAEAQRLTRAEGGTLYLTDRRLADRRARSRFLRFSIIRNDLLGIRLGHDDDVQTQFAPLPLRDAAGEENHRHVACHAALTKKVVNVPDVYSTTRFDFTGTREFDLAHNTRSVSLLAVPLVNAANETVGVLQLINAHNTDGTVTSFSGAAEEAAGFLARFAAAALDQQRLADEQRQLLVTLSAEPTTGRLLERILDEAQRLAHAEGGTLYLFDESDIARPSLRFALLRNDVLGLVQGGVDGTPITLPLLPLLDAEGQVNHRLVAAHVAHTRQMINIPDVYEVTEFDFSGTRKFDDNNGYRSRSMLTIPLLNHAREMIGVLQLINARDADTGRVVPFGDRVVPVINALASYAAIALNNQILVQELKGFLDAFIKTIAKAIDAKSPHTSAHCQRVPLLTELIAQAACNDDDGEFKSFNLDEDGWYELRVASWLHDCGKLSTPDSVLEKSTKLHGLRDGIETVRVRFAVARREIELDYLRRMAASPQHSDDLQAELAAALAALDDDCRFIGRSNKGGEFMSEELRDRVRTVAQRSWHDVDGIAQPMLNDHEIRNLCIERGTLSAEERQKINDHMKVTIDMLEGLPFPKKLRRVPEYAGGHHEKMDGTGFPKGLTREQMSWPARMMAVADIFEALTSSDRPYKAPMKISQALSIMKRMRDDRHIDPSVYQLFLEKRVWEQYAQAAPLKPEQLDVADVAAFR